MGQVRRLGWRLPLSLLPGETPAPLPSPLDKNKWQVGAIRLWPQHLAVPGDGVPHLGGRAAVSAAEESGSWTGGS